MQAQISFGPWLKQRRKLLDLTQDELARRVGCALSTLQKFETDERRPSKQIAELLARELDIPADERAAFVRYARAASDALPSPPPAVMRVPAPWRTQQRSCTNLPAQSTPLIGRDDDIVRAYNLFTSRNVRLLTLTGPAGVGKTRLGIQVAENLLDEFEDGVHFIALAAIRDPELIGAAIAQALALKETKGQPLAERVKEHLADRRVLLLLDNFEQVIAAALFVAELLAACAWLKVLVTSRAPLCIRAERQFPVAPLALPNPAQLQDVAALSRFPAVTLFVDRAQSAQPAFVLTAENAAAVANICARLDGLPLAIELVAARVNQLSPQMLVAQLAHKHAPLRILGGGARDLPLRHRTLRNAIGWSYDLLHAQEQTLFARMSVFVGGCTQEAAQVICSGAIPNDPYIADGLASLVDKSLLRRHESVDGALRFTMLETIREYALEKLTASGEGEAISKQHAAYFVAQAEAAEGHLTGPQQTEWLRRLEREYDNMRAALQWALEHGEALLAARLGGALRHFWVMHGHLAEGRRWLERAHSALVAQSAASPASVLVKLLNSEGCLAYYQGDYSAARAFFERGLALARAQDDKWGMAFALDGLGVLATNFGDYEQAVAWAQSSLELSRAIGAKWLCAVTLINLGELARLQGDYRQATRHYEESLALLRQVGDKSFIAIVFHDLGQVMQEQGEYERAQALHQEGLGLGAELGNPRGIATGLEKLAGAAAARGQPVPAARLLGAADALRQTVRAPMEALDRTAYEHCVAAVRAQLDDVTFDAAWGEGRAMQTEQAIAFALAME